MICWQFSPMRQLGACSGNHSSPTLTHGAPRLKQTTHKERLVALLRFALMGRNVVRLDNVVQIPGAHVVVPSDAVDLVVLRLQNRLDQFPGLLQTKPGEGGKQMMLGVEIEIEHQQFAENAVITAGACGGLLLPNV